MVSNTGFVMPKLIRITLAIAKILLKEGMVIISSGVEKLSKILKQLHQFTTIDHCFRGPALNLVQPVPIFCVPQNYPLMGIDPE